MGATGEQLDAQRQAAGHGAARHLPGDHARLGARGRRRRRLCHGRPCGAAQRRAAGVGHGRGGAVRAAAAGGSRGGRRLLAGRRHGQRGRLAAAAPRELRAAAALLGRRRDAPPRADPAERGAHAELHGLHQLHPQRCLGGPAPPASPVGGREHAHPGNSHCVRPSWPASNHLRSPLTLYIKQPKRRAFNGQGASCDPVGHRHRIIAPV
mmetsp:Transcript_38326/g.96337  ORF Transcript_38326/g.96337 Transcript_38326/m.96337 type:complete len:209 (-) Transcript_38326:493-1119(-)